MPEALLCCGSGMRAAHAARLPQGHGRWCVPQGSSINPAMLACPDTKLAHMQNEMKPPLPYRTAQGRTALGRTERPAEFHLPGPQRAPGHGVRLGLVQRAAGPAEADRLLPARLLCLARWQGAGTACLFKHHADMQDLQRMQGRNAMELVMKMHADLH